MRSAYGIQILRVKQLVGIAPDELAGFVAQKRAADGRSVEVDALGAVAGDHIRGVLGQETIASFTVP